MADTTTPNTANARGRSDGLAAPLREPIFRRIWLASLFSNLGLLIQGVGAAWTMTQLTTDAGLVALVQSAQMLPLMLLSLAAGAIADMYDRRRVALVALSISVSGAVCLTLIAHFHLISPPVLLAFCFIIGSGSALFSPAWQASVSEQVPSETLSAAISLNSISYNIARSIGPAVGGLIVAAAGSVAAFGANALCYLPLIFVLYRWRRVQEPSRLPPERLGRAIVSGVRYVTLSPAIRTVTVRTLLSGFAGGGLSALLPLVARHILHGGAPTYGLLLGAFGIGSVTAAMCTSAIRRALSAETVVRLATLLLSAATAMVGVSRATPLTAASLFIAGGCWMVIMNMFNVGVQFSAPRWVTGRALATFQAAIAGGIALGAWTWGSAANTWGVEKALLMSASTLVFLPLLGLWLKMPPVGGRNENMLEVLPDPEVQLAITGRSGPIIIDFEYRVSLDQARAFYRAMQEVQRIRQRNGGYGWSLSRDIREPELWVETFTCPTWHDYLHQRSRTTKAEREHQTQANSFHMGPEPIKVRRRLERPLGSVRWKEEAPDRDTGAVLPSTPTGGGA